MKKTRMIIGAVLVMMLPPSAGAGEALPFTVKSLTVVKAERQASNQLRQCDDFMVVGWTKLVMQVAIAVSWKLNGSESLPVYDLAWELQSADGTFQASEVKAGGIEPMKQPSSPVQVAFDTTYTIGINSGSECPAPGSSPYMVEPPQGLYNIRLSLVKEDEPLWSDQRTFQFAVTP